MDNPASITPENMSELIESYISRGELEQLRALINEYHPADIADVLDELPAEHALLVFDHCEQERVLRHDGARGYDLRVVEV